MTARTVVPSVVYRPVPGIYREDVTRLHGVLAGVSWPAQKWQLIAHAERDPVGPGRPDQRTVEQLWALPTGRYIDPTQVLAAAARTARGHPHRLPPVPGTDHAVPVTD